MGIGIGGRVFVVPQGHLQSLVVHLRTAPTKTSTTTLLMDDLNDNILLRVLAYLPHTSTVSAVQTHCEQEDWHIEGETLEERSVASGAIDEREVRRDEASPHLTLITQLNELKSNERSSCGGF